MKLTVGTMKNLASNLDKGDVALFRQVIVPVDNKRFCPIEALSRQLQLLEQTPANESNDWLFRRVNYTSNKLQKEQTTEETYK